MLRRHEIQVLRRGRAGHGQIEAAKLAGISLGSEVRRVEREPGVCTDSVRKDARRGIGRPAKPSSFAVWWPSCCRRSQSCCRSRSRAARSWRATREAKRRCTISSVRCVRHRFGGSSDSRAYGHEMDVTTIGADVSSAYCLQAPLDLQRLQGSCGAGPRPAQGGARSGSRGAAAKPDVHDQ